MFFFICYMYNKQKSKCIKRMAAPVVTLTVAVAAAPVAIVSIVAVVAKLFNIPGCVF